ncbi:permease-like cell division protein FtsX [Spirillospora sp. NPDC048911]|uniref:permease-like cell division protein FtsX n=1 Tax=Spirillospora sp. NPDC048911 TaxID=3364527 RepID=UPI003719394D
MNTSTEERLAGALKGVGDTLGPEDVSALDLAGARRGRSLFARPMVIVAAAAASVALAAGGVAVLNDGDESPRGARPLSQSPTTHEIRVFLCAKKSSSPTCRKRSATREEKDAVRRALKAEGVYMIKYESPREARQRFVDQFKNGSSVKVGDIPDSFLVTARTASVLREVTARVMGMPGVDKAVTLKEMGRSPYPESQ